MFLEGSLYCSLFFLFSLLEEVKRKMIKQRPKNIEKDLRRHHFRLPVPSPVKEKAPEHKFEAEAPTELRPNISARSRDEESRRKAPMSVIHQSENSHKYYENSPMMARAKEINNPDLTLLQGKVIKAVLETEINSDLPGMIRAVVSENVFADRGNQILIPKGSRLVGAYSSEIALGQRRVMVKWTRMIHASTNMDVNFSSPGADSLGRSGMGGEVNNKFFQGLERRHY